LIKSLSLLGLLVLLPVTAYAQNTIEQVDNDFPAAIILTDNGQERTRMLLLNIVEVREPTRITWNTALMPTALEQKLDTLGDKILTVDGIKAHHTPLAAIVRGENITALAKVGNGFQLDLEKGVYVVDIAIKSDISQHIGIYESILYVDEPERDDLRLMEITTGFTDEMKLEFATEADKL
jgi:hypothetical protein